MSEEIRAHRTTSFYQYQLNELGIFTEIYLPKRAAYQGILYKTLTKGFDFATIKKDHFADQAKVPRILHFIAEYGWQGVEERNLQSINKCFAGYSMYEIDGVFWSESRRKAIEEKTQVIRIMFVKNDFREKFKQLENTDYITVRDFARRYLKSNREEGRRIKRSAQRKFERNLSRKWEYEIVQDIDSWINDTAMFVFGYLLFEISEKIGALLEPEEEIWVTSFWDMHVNKVTQTSTPSCYILSQLGIVL